MALCCAALELIMGRKMEVEEIVGHKFCFLPNNLAPMARDMPAIPWMRHW